MKKKDFTSDFAEIKAMTDRIRGINESINFEEDTFDDVPADEPEIETVDEPIDDGADMDRYGSDQEETYDYVAKIREICLKGMFAYCHTPEKPEYGMLKKIFSMLDKVNEKKPEAEA